MYDLFRAKGTNAEERLLDALFGGSNKVWAKRSEEARAYMDEFLERHPDYWEDSFTTPEDLADEIREQLQQRRFRYLNIENPSANDRFSLAYDVEMLITLLAIVEMYGKDNPDVYIALCAKGQAAIRREVRRKKWEEKYGKTTGDNS